MQKYNHNYTMLCDFYELTMGNGYYVSGMKDTMTYFDLFYRTVPDQGGFAIAAGLEQAVDYIRDLHFDDEDIAYLRSRGIFDEGFLDYLRNFKFTGDVWAVPEGTPVYAADNGKVIVAGDLDNGYGNYIILDHQNGYKTLYAHNSELLVSVGDIVAKGDKIAFSGNTGNSTGPHLHFEVQVNDEKVVPQQYLTLA